MATKPEDNAPSSNVTRVRLNQYGQPIGLKVPEGKRAIQVRKYRQQFPDTTAERAAIADYMRGQKQQQAGVLPVDEGTWDYKNPPRDKGGRPLDKENKPLPEGAVGFDPYGRVNWGEGFANYMKGVAYRMSQPITEKVYSRGDKGIKQDYREREAMPLEKLGMGVKEGIGIILEGLNVPAEKWEQFYGSLAMTSKEMAGKYGTKSYKDWRDFFLEGSPIGIAYNLGQYALRGTDKERWDDAWERNYQAARIAYSAYFDPAIRQEFLRQYESGADPYMLAMELEHPIAEMVGQFVADPLNLIDVLTFGMMRSARAKKAVEAVTKVADADVAKVLGKIGKSSSDARALEDVAELVVRDALSLRKAEKGFEAAGSGLKAYNPLARTAMGKRSAIARQAGEVAGWIATTLKQDPDATADLLLAMARRASKNPDEALVGLNHIMNYPASQPLFSEAGNNLAILLNKMMSDADGNLDAAKFLAGIQDCGSDYGKLVAYIEGKMTPVLKKMFPDINDLIARAGTVVEGEFTEDALLAAEQLKKVPKSAIFANSVNNAGRKIYGPLNQFFSNIYMGMSPGYAFRNGLQNTVQAFIDMGPKGGIKVGGATVQSILKPGATASKLETRTARRLGGMLPSSFRWGFGGGPAAAADVVSEGGEDIGFLKKIGQFFLRRSEAAEAGASAAIVDKSVADSMHKALKPGRAIPDGRPLIEAGMNEADVRTLQNLIINNYGDARAAEEVFREAIKTGDLDVIKVLEEWASAEDISAMRAMGYLDDVRDAVRDADNLDDTRAAISKIFNDSLADGRKVAGEAQGVNPGDDAYQTSVGLSKAASERHISDEALDLVNRQINANSQANRLTEDSVRTVGINEIARLSKEDPEKAAEINALYTSFLERFDNIRSQKRLDDDMFIKAVWELSDKIKATKKPTPEDLEEMWRLSELIVSRGEPPQKLSKKSFLDYLWDGFCRPNRREYWTQSRELFASEAEKFFAELSRITGVDFTVAPEVERAREALELARVWDTAVPAGRGVFAPGRRSAAWDAARKLGVFDEFDASGVGGDRHLLNAINKWLPEGPPGSPEPAKFRYLDEVPEDIAEAALKSRMAEKEKAIAAGKKASGMPEPEIKVADDQVSKHDADIQANIEAAAKARGDVQEVEAYGVRKIVEKMKDGKLLSDEEVDFFNDIAARFFTKEERAAVAGARKDLDALENSITQWGEAEKKLYQEAVDSMNDVLDKIVIRLYDEVNKLEEIGNSTWRSLKTFARASSENAQSQRLPEIQDKIAQLWYETDVKFGNLMLDTTPRTLDDIKAAKQEFIDKLHEITGIDYTDNVFLRKVDDVIDEFRSGTKPPKTAEQIAREEVERAKAAPKPKEDNILTYYNETKRGYIKRSEDIRADIVSDIEGNKISRENIHSNVLLTNTTVEESQKFRDIVDEIESILVKERFTEEVEQGWKVIESKRVVYRDVSELDEADLNRLNDLKEELFYEVDRLTNIIEERSINELDDFIKNTNRAGKSLEESRNIAAQKAREVFTHNFARTPTRQLPQKLREQVIDEAHRLIDELSGGAPIKPRKAKGTADEWLKGGTTNPPWYTAMYNSGMRDRKLVFRSLDKIISGKDAGGGVYVTYMKELILGRLLEPGADIGSFGFGNPELILLSGDEKQAIRAFNSIMEQFPDADPSTIVPDNQALAEWFYERYMDSLVLEDWKIGKATEDVAKYTTPPPVSSIGKSPTQIVLEGGVPDFVVEKWDEVEAAKEKLNMLKEQFKGMSVEERAQADLAQKIKAAEKELSAARRELKKVAEETNMTVSDLANRFKVAEETASQPVTETANVVEEVAENAREIPTAPVDGVMPMNGRWQHEQADGIKRLRDSVLGSLEKSWGKKKPVIADKNIDAALTAYIKDAEERIATTRLSAVQVANATRDFALLNYQDKRYLDLAAAYIFPYHFWYSRTYKNWLNRLVSDPAIVAGYGRYRETLAKIHSDQPDWWKYTVNTNELFGLMPENPLFFNLEATFNPLNGLTGIDFDDPDRRVNWWTNTLDQLGKFGPSVWTPFQLATAAALYLQGEKDAAARWGNRLIPQTATLKSITALANIGPAGGLELDPAVLAFSGGTDPYEKKRIARALGALQRDGLITEAQQIDAANSQKGPIWEMAMDLAAKARAPGQLSSFLLGVGFKARSVSDMEIDKFYQQHRYLWAMEPNLDPDEFRNALEELRQRYPFMDAVLLARKSGPERDRSYAYNVLGRIGPGAKSQVSEVVGIDPELMTRFYEDKGHIEYWSEPDRVNFMTALVEIAAILDVPDTATKQEWNLASAEYRKMMTEAQRLFGEDIEQRVDLYYAAKGEDYKSKQRADAVLAADPAIEKFMDWKTAYVFSNNLLSIYYGGISNVYNFYNGTFYTESEEKFGKDIFDKEQEYYLLKDSGEDYKAYKEDHPELEELWAFRKYWKKIIADKVARAGSYLKEGKPMILRPDADASSVGARKVMEYITNPSEPVMSWEQWQQVLPKDITQVMYGSFKRDLDYPDSVLVLLEEYAQQLGWDVETMVEQITMSLNNQ